MELEATSSAWCLWKLLEWQSQIVVFLLVGLGIFSFPLFKCFVFVIHLRLYGIRETILYCSLTLVYKKLEPIEGN